LTDDQHHHDYKYSHYLLFLVALTWADHNNNGQQINSTISMHSFVTASLELIANIELAIIPHREVKKTASIISLD
jgi:hypothetical protein